MFSLKFSINTVMNQLSQKLNIISYMSDSGLKHAQLSYLVLKFNFYQKNGGGKDWTIDHLVIETCIPCHETTLLKAWAVEWECMNDFHYYFSN